MFLETFKTEGLSIYTYLLGCGDDAAVVDPTRDIQPILDRLDAKNVSLNYIFETHIHADFLSGARQLADATGATIIASGEGLDGEATQYGYDQITPIHDGNSFRIGQVELKAVHTPGHTPEHMSYLLTDHARSSDPLMIFTGDFLFVGSIGRPDLLGGNSVRPLANALYDTLYDGSVTKLPDHLLVLPGHGSGSACGKAIGDVPTSTLGTERRFNEAFQYKGRREDFVNYILNDQPAAPRYFPMMKKLNRQGPDLLKEKDLTQVPFMRLNHFMDKIWDYKEGKPKSNIQLLDLRKPTAFAGGHIPQSVSIWYSDSVATWGGWTLNYEDPIYLVHDNEYELKDAVRQLRLVGFDNVSGALYNGFDSWQTSGYPIQRLQTIDVYQLEKDMKTGDVQILDVRTDSEYQTEHLDNSIHIEAGYIEDHLNEFDKDKTYAVLCGGGYRATIAASLLAKHGITNTAIILGGISAWKDHQELVGAKS